MLTFCFATHMRTERIQIQLRRPGETCSTSSIFFSELSVTVWTDSKMDVYSWNGTVNVLTSRPCSQMAWSAFFIFSDELLSDLLIVIDQDGCLLTRLFLSFWERRHTLKDTDRTLNLEPQKKKKKKKKKKKHQDLKKEILTSCCHRDTVTFCLLAPEGHSAAVYMCAGSQP